MSRRALRPIVVLDLIMVLGMAAVLPGCGSGPTPPAPPCPAGLALSAAGLTRGQPVEETPGGGCLAARAAGGDIAAALRLGDFYAAQPGPLPLIDTNGREVHWYRLAGDLGSPLGAWRATQLIDTDEDRQVPNDALAYLFTAVKGGIPEAGDYLIEQWQNGRIDPGKLWGMRRWLNKPGPLPEAERTGIIAGLAEPADELEPE
jgi:hypothetical protein